MVHPGCLCETCELTVEHCQTPELFFVEVLDGWDTEGGQQGNCTSAADKRNVASHKAGNDYV